MGSTTRTVASALLLALAATGCGGGTDAQSSLRRGIELEAAKDYRAAQIEFKNAVLKAPDSAEARLHLARVHLQFGLGAEAEKELLKSVELGTPRQSLETDISRAYLLQGQYAKVIEFDKAAAAETVAPTGLSAEARTARAELIALRGHAYYLSGDAKTAEQRYTEALDLVPDNREALLGKIRNVATRANMDESKRKMRELTAKSPDFSAAWGYLGNLELATSNFDAAAEAYGHAVDTSPNNFEFRVGRLHAWISAEKFDQAREELKTYKGLKPPEIHYMNAQLLIHDRKYEEAQQALVEALALAPDYSLANYDLGRVSFLLRQYERAESALVAASQLESLRNDAQRLLAMVRLQRGDRGGAEQILREVLQRTPGDAQSLTLLSQVALASGKTDEGLSYLRKVVAQQPASAEALVQLGVGELRAGERERGLSTLKSAMTADPSSKAAAYQLVLAELEAKRYDEALAQTKKLQEADAKDALAVNLEGLVYLRQGDFARARTTLSRALALDPHLVAAALNLSNLEAYEKNLEGADKVLSTALGADGVDLTGLMRLAEIKTLRGQPEPAVALLKRATAAHPLEVAPRVVLARLLMQRGQAQEALAALQDVVADNPNDAALLTELGKAHLLLGRVDEALKTFQHLVEQHPEQPLAHYLLASAYETRAPQKMEAELERALQIQADFYPARLALARLKTVMRKPAEAEALIETLEEQTPDSPDVLLAKADLALYSRDFTKADAAYRRGQEKYPNLNQWVLGRSLALWNAGSREESLEPLETWLTQHPDDLQVLVRSADILKELGRADAAIQRYELVLSKAPNNPVVLNQIAWGLRDKAPAKALGYAEKAHKIAPNHPAVLDTYGYLLLKSGKLELALKSLTQAVEAAPEQPSAQYHLAMAYRQARDTERARKALGEALRNSAVEFPEREMARKMLDDLAK